VNAKISPKIALVAIAVAVAICALVYANLPTGMVVHMTAKMPARGMSSGRRLPPTRSSHKTSPASETPPPDGKKPEGGPLQMNRS